MAIATHSTAVPAAIDRLQAAIRQQQLLRRDSARAALKAADGLLNQLELLVLAGQREVPASMFASLDTIQRAASRLGIEPVGLESKCGVLRLMDDVYELEAKLLRRCH